MRTALMFVLLAACGSDDDGGESTPPDAAVDSFTTCTGACMTTALTASFGGVTRTLDAAYYGITAATGRVYMEILGGGADGCPEMNDPPADYQLVLAGTDVPTTTAAQTSNATLLDYEADLLGGAIHAMATATVLTPTAANSVTTPSGMVAFDAQITFPTGTVSGHLYASHCASFDQ